MHNDEEHPHLHFYVYSDTEVNAKMLHDGFKNGSSPGAFKKGAQAFQDEYHEQVASRCGLARTGPKRRRLSRAEWHAEQEMAMSISKAESAVLDSAASKEKEAHKRLQAAQQQAELLAKEKRATREAMQKALALQAEAREKIAQSEALLAQYGLADVAPQPTPAPEASRRLQSGVRAMSAYQANAGFDRSQLHYIGQQSGEPPNPQPPGRGSLYEQPPRGGCDGRSPWAAERSEQRGGAGGTPCKLVQGAAPGRGILE